MRGEGGNLIFPKLHGQMGSCLVLYLPSQTLTSASGPPVSRDAKTALAATGVPAELASIFTATGTPASVSR